MTELESAVIEYLRQRECSRAAIKGGISRLVADWERFVDSILVSKDLYIYDYLVHLERRRILADIFVEVPGVINSEYFEKVAKADQIYRSVTDSIFACLDAPPGVRDRDPDKYWFYYQKPKGYGGSDWQS